MSYMPDKQEKGSYEVGQALTVSGGKVAKIGAALKTTPNYVSVARKVLADGENLPVMRVKPDIIWQTELSAETAGAVVGAKLEVSAGGMAVDGTDAGTFEVVYAQGTEAGSKVTGRFV